MEKLGDRRHRNVRLVWSKEHLSFDSTFFEDSIPQSMRRSLLLDAINSVRAAKQMLAYIRGKHAEDVWGVHGRMNARVQNTYRSWAIG